jgi:hypothetical protein
MIGILVFTCAKDRLLTPLCIEALQRVPDARIIVCDDEQYPANTQGYPVIPWSMRGEGGWAGGVTRALAEAHRRFPECDTLATVDADIMILDPSFFDLPDEGCAVRGCPRPQNRGWFSLRVFWAGMVPLLQGLSGQEEDKIIGEALKRESYGRFVEDGMLVASQELSPPMAALQRLRAHAVHVGQFYGDHKTREKALIQAENIVQALRSEVAP